MNNNKNHMDNYITAGLRDEAYNIIDIDCAHADNGFKKEDNFFLTIESEGKEIALSLQTSSDYSTEMNWISDSGKRFTLEDVICGKDGLLYARSWGRLIKVDPTNKKKYEEAIVKMLKSAILQTIKNNHSSFSFSVDPNGGLHTEPKP